jgi:hypothetical protein
VARPRLTIVLSSCANACQAPVPHILPTACSTASSTSDTIRRKAMPRIMPNDSSRERKSRHQPLAVLGAGARQIRSRLFCSSPNTVVAPRISTNMPTTVAITPSFDLFTLASRPSIALAPSSPISPCSAPVSSPRTASSPKNQPATAMTMRSSGAIENSV